MGLRPDEFLPGGGAESQMALFSHPVHPMLVAFPIAFLHAVVLTDLACLWTADPFWARASYWLLLASVVSGGAASLVGFSDWLLVRDIRRHLTSWGHFLAAVTMMSLVLANWLQRLDRHEAAIMPWGLFMSVLTVAMLLVAAWLGGRLVFEHNLGPGSPLYEAVRQDED